MTATRRLAAIFASMSRIFAADGADEEGTLVRLLRRRVLAASVLNSTVAAQAR
jgi:hypothetical protein